MDLTVPDLASFAPASPEIREQLPPARHHFAPETAEEAGSMLAAATASGAAVVPWGGGTHQGLGRRVAPDVVISTARLDRIVDWQPEDLTVVVEAGVTVDALEARLAERQQTAALPERAPGATVGGVVAAGISGYRRPRYGPTRDRILQTTLATGDGRVVTAGATVVKNVSGYDIQRTAAGSLGSIGLITSVCLKLWPRSTRSATVPVADAARAWSILYRPLAVLETGSGSYAYLEGPPAQIEGDAAAIGSEPVDGLDWPDVPTGEVTAAVLVPPSVVSDVVERVRPSLAYVAQHGVGRVDVAGPADHDWESLRAWAETRGGRLTVTGAPDPFYDRFDPWGEEPPGVAVQRRLIAAFDPAGVINPGRLPGDL